MDEKQATLPTEWRIEATDRARAALNNEDLQAGVWRHLAFLTDALEQARGGFGRTVSHDRHGREFWAVSSLSEGLTIVLLPDEA